MTGRAWIAASALVLFASASASASFVRNIAPSTGIGTNANLLSTDWTDKVGQDPGPNTNEDYVGPGPLNNNFADINFDVLQQNSPFNVQVQRMGGTLQAAEYWFEVTVNNLTGSTITGFDVALLSAPNGAEPGTLVRHDLPPIPTPTGGTFTRLSDSLARFSGLSIAPGASQTLGFSLDLLADLVVPFGDQNDDFYIQFTATPEPHSILLGAMSLLALIGVVLQRRSVRAATVLNSDAVQV